MNDYQETMIFSFETVCDDQSSVSTRTLDPEFLTLDKIAEGFTYFLHSAGFTYVTGVSIHKGDNDPVEFNGE